MSDEIDIPEPEHDHLLDHEFHENESWAEQDSQEFFDNEDEEDDHFDHLDPIDEED